MEFTLHHNCDDRWDMRSPHFHDKLEVLLSLSEGGSFFLMDNIHPLHRGTLLLMCGQVLHRSTAMDSSYERYVLHIPQETLGVASSHQTDFRALLNQNCCIQLSETDLEQMCKLMEQCLSASAVLGDDILRDCSFLSLLVMLGRILQQSTERLIPAAVFSPPVQHAIDWINLRLSDDLSLDVLAERCYITKYHLCRIFKEETGFTIGEYIIQLRLRRAAGLLKAGESVQRAGEAAGFRSNSHFIRTFGKVMGVSPGKYRRRHADL